MLDGGVPVSGSTPRVPLLGFHSSGSERSGTVGPFSYGSCFLTGGLLLL